MEGECFAGWVGGQNKNKTTGGVRIEIQSSDLKANLSKLLSPQSHKSQRPPITGYVRSKNSALEEPLRSLSPDVGVSLENSASVAGVCNGSVVLCIFFFSVFFSLA